MLHKILCKEFWDLIVIGHGFAALPFSEGAVKDVEGGVVLTVFLVVDVQQKIPKAESDRVALVVCTYLQ